MTLFQTILNEDLAATEELLRQGSNPNLVEFSGASAFHVAVGLDNLELSEDVTRLILQYGGDPNVRSSEGSTPVHTAAAFGRCENLRLLLLNGGDPFLVDQDGMDVLANARASGCSLCCAIVKQHQQKLLDDTVKSTDTRSLYTITPYVPCTDHPLHPLNSERRHAASDPFVSPPRDQFCFGGKSTEHRGKQLCHHNPCPMQMETETKFGKNWEEWRLGAVSDSVISGSSVSETESRREATRADKGFLEQRSSAGSHDSFYTCSDPGNGSISGAGKNVYKSEKFFEVHGVAALPGNEELISRLDSVKDEKSGALWDGGDGYSLLECTLSNNSDRYSSETGDESVAVSRSFQLPSDYYSSSSDDDECTVSRGHVMPPVSDELSRFHLDVFRNGGEKHRGSDDEKCTSSRDDVAPPISELSRFHLDVFRNGGEKHRGSDDDKCTSSRDHVAPPISELSRLHLDVFRDEVTRRATYELSDNDECTGSRDNVVPPVSDLSRLHLDVFRDGGSRDGRCELSVINESQFTEDMGLSVINESQFTEDGGNVSPTPGMVDGVDVTRKYTDSASRLFFSPETNGCHITEASDLEVTPKHDKCTSEYAPCGDRPQCLDYDFPKHGRFALNGCRGAGDFNAVKSWMDAPVPSKDSGIEKRLFSGCTQPYPPSDISVISISSIESHASLNSTVQYVYTDDEDGYSLLATRFLPIPLGGDRNSAALDDGILELGDAELRSRLTDLGDVPGPIMSSTRRLYQSRLDRLLKSPTLADVQDSSHREFLPELTRALAGHLDMSSIEGLEDLMSEPFADPCASRRWREGTLKTSFNYLLLDPRVSQNLPARHKTMDELEAFGTFVRAVFYIGKGKRSRPYAHFKEAIQNLSGITSIQRGAKVQRIIDVWEAGQGVISLHVFQNVIPVEAYTREACIIDAFGLDRLTNLKGGECYGPVTTWSRVQRRMLGVHLLYKAFRILLIEGERQIQPHHISVGQ